MVCFFDVMEEILHQLIGSFSHYLQCFLTSQVVSRISSINSSISFCHFFFLMSAKKIVVQLQMR